MEILAVSPNPFEKSSMRTSILSFNSRLRISILSIFGQLRILRNFQYFQQYKPSKPCFSDINC